MKYIVSSKSNDAAISAGAQSATEALAQIESYNGMGSVEVTENGRVVSVEELLKLSKQEPTGPLA